MEDRAIQLLNQSGLHCCQFVSKCIYGKIVETMEGQINGKVEDRQQLKKMQK